MATATNCCLPSLPMAGPSGSVAFCTFSPIPEEHLCDLGDSLTFPSIPSLPWGAQLPLLWMAKKTNPKSATLQGCGKLLAWQRGGRGATISWQLPIPHTEGSHAATWSLHASYIPLATSSCASGLHTCSVVVPALRLLAAPALPLVPHSPQLLLLRHRQPHAIRAIPSPPVQTWLWQLLQLQGCHISLPRAFVLLLGGCFGFGLSSSPPDEPACQDARREEARRLHTCAAGAANLCRQAAASGFLFLIGTHPPAGHHVSFIARSHLGDGRHRLPGAPLLCSRCDTRAPVCAVPMAQPSQHRAKKGRRKKIHGAPRS